MAEQPPETTISITRIFDAPRERVWEAWTTPAQFAQWFGAGRPAPAEYTSMDLKPGGVWESTMVLSEDGAQTKRFWGEPATEGWRGFFDQLNRLLTKN